MNSRQLNAGKENVPARVARIKPFLAMEILEEAQLLEAEGASIVHLELGEPGGETPALVKEAAFHSLARNETGYTHSQGTAALRQAIGEYYARTYGVEVDPARVIVTSGSSAAMLLAFSALLEQGDRLLMADPYYACYPNYALYVGAEPHPVRVREEDGFKLRADAVAASLDERVKAILINSPANPTGTVLDGEDLAGLAALGRFIVSDEVYHGLNYGQGDHTILEYTDEALVINGFSKRSNMTGWRLGYLIAPPRLVRVMQTLQQNLFICACSFIQAAGIAALQEDPRELALRREAYNERRLYLYRSLREMGLAPAVMPEGAFYMLANVRRYTRDSYALARRILREAGVALTPGIDFGPGGEGYLRLSYASTMEELALGLTRLKDFFDKLEPLPAGPGEEG